MYLKLCLYYYFLNTECQKIKLSDKLKFEIIQKVSYEDGTLFEGSIIEFSCEDNFILSDSDKTHAECVNNGEWNVTAPYCVKGRHFLKYYLEKQSN